MAQYAEIQAHSITANHLTYDVLNRLQKPIITTEKAVNYPTIVFGETIDAGSLISIIDNKAYKANNSDYNYHCQGLAIVSGDANSENVYTTNGIFSYWNDLIPNKPVFLSANGGITQTPNFTIDTVFQEIGTAISNTTINIQIKTPKLNAA